MFSLVKKEVGSFFSSLVGYITIIIFLLAIGLFMWVVPGETNVFDSGFSDLGFLFINAPAIFLFLIPAITMRLFAEERRMQTLELLFTKPITDFQIIIAKYLAGIILLLLSLLPTVVYYFSVVQLGNPMGNIDSGGTIGSYIGLFFLGASFLSVGLFASSITTNQIVSFLVAVVLCFIVYLGFDFIGNNIESSELAYVIKNFGIEEHYASIQRGVIDSRDLLYFISLIAVFLLATKLSLKRGK
jgi:ABC-2 type transport system permease protein